MQKLKSNKKFVMKRCSKRSISINGGIRITREALETVDVWSRGLLNRIHASLGRKNASRVKLNDGTNPDHQSWEETKHQSSAFAILGRRPRMEDRFIVEENINNNTGISFFAVFDGHGGEFAADFAKDILVKNIYNKIIETTKLLDGQRKMSLNAVDDAEYSEYDVNPYLKRKASRKLDESNKENEATIRRRDSLRKAHSTADDCSTSSSQANGNSLKETDIFTSKLNSLIKGGKDHIFSNKKNGNSGEAGNVGPVPPIFEAKCYIENGKINFGKMITDEVLAADYKLVEAAKKTTNIAGTTALIAILEGGKLTVANVGDSRGVMCDMRGIAIPLSFDHKPQQVRERKRIHDAGGFIAFRGVWRVAGILATSRALGDYPLKDKNLVIANPDILSFDLNDHKPTFLILASDGLWDTFTNEEAVSYIKEHIMEPDFGAKSLAMQSYYRGSVDNITVLVIVFRNGVYQINEGSSLSSASGAASGNKIAANGKSVANGNTVANGNAVNQNNLLHAKHQ